MDLLFHILFLGACIKVELDEFDAAMRVHILFQHQPRGLEMEIVWHITAMASIDKEEFVQTSFNMF